MGRPIKPTALKVIEGNRGKRALNRQEPDPEYLNDLAPPAWLDATAAIVWDELAPALRHCRLLTKIDVHALSMGCVAIAQYRQAATEVVGNLVCHSPVAAESKGDSINPWLVVQSMSFKQAMTVLREFGMSPAARTRIAIQPQGNLFPDGDKDSTARFFS